MTSLSSPDRLSFWEHVTELRATLIRVALALFAGFIVAFFFREELIQWLLKPITPFSQTVLLGPLDGIKVVLKVCFWTGAIFSSPLWIFFMIQFFLPALRQQERKIALFFVTLTFTLMGIGALIAFRFSLPLIISYLTSFNAELGANLWTLSHSITFVLWVILVHVLCFELFLLLMTLIHFHLISAFSLKKGRPYAFVSIFIFSALLTPPDIVTQLFLALPLIGLYELAHLYAKICLNPIQKDLYL